MEENEEEKNVSICQSSTSSSGTDDSLLYKKHLAMLERLSNLHQTRLNQSNSRKSDPNSSCPFESTQSFLTHFAESKQSIESDIERLRHLPDSQPELRSHLDNISIAIADLDRLVAENSYFLPSYEVRSTLKSIAELKEKLDIANRQLVPRKKFSFKNKPAKRTPDSQAPDPEPIEEPNLIPKAANDDQKLDLVAKAADRLKSPGFRNEVGTVLTKQFVGFEDGDFTISNVESCEVRLKGRLRALFVDKLKDCRVFVGPVLGSVLIEEVENCLFMLASHQVRIHHAKACDFYLRVRSRPIIEDSENVRFGPYLLSYKGIEQELRQSGLGEDSGNWENVDDFKWLRAVQSPNWKVLGVEERVCTVDLTDLDQKSEEM